MLIVDDGETRQGLFRSLYETADYEKVYGKSFAILEGEWRASLPRR